MRPSFQSARRPGRRHSRFRQSRDGNKVAISFTGESGDRQYNLKVVCDDGDDATWSDVNLCELSNIHIHWDKSAGATPATGD
jgi:hypothetical protein